VPTSRWPTARPLPERSNAGSARLECRGNVRIGRVNTVYPAASPSCAAPPIAAMSGLAKREGVLRNFTQGLEQGGSV